ncbi:FixH family protein [Aureitalea sp. L0-47]|uniref:FixH family protein n=1 Tax=Aureitalea sp. L0-47 TaxID=2816962 RepID=UPI002237FEA3|nr:FixH family protein [Aureitalea sp. L0-47]MCW5520094.1 FixH family protein [Aureitalea sp. L0-47]
MKFNWGTGIVIGMVLFIGFIMYMVITMMTDDAYNHDLVTEGYYEKDLQYQKEINAEENSQKKFANITGEKVAEGWLLHFPEDLDPNKIKGKVFLYRPSNKRLDFDIPIVISNAQLLIPDERLLDGRWNITLDWEYEGEHYMYKESIVY